MKNIIRAFLVAAAILSTCVSSGAASQPAKAEEITVYVTGVVKAPGKYVLPKGSRVSDAIARAGRVSRSFASERIRLTRREPNGETSTIEVNLTGRGSRPAEDPVLRNDDSVFVPQSFG